MVIRGSKTRIKESPYEIKSIGVKKGDVLVLMSEKQISPVTAEQIRLGIKELFPDNKVMVLADGLKMHVISPEPVENQDVH